LALRDVEYRTRIRKSPQLCHDLTRLDHSTYMGTSGSMTKILPGDVVWRRKGVLIHKGIALPGDRVLHNTPLAGEHVSATADFARGHRVYPRRLKAEQRQRVLDAARPGASRRYNLFTNNCEHTVSRASDGKPSSPQLDAWLVGLGVGALAFAVTRRPSLAVAGFGLGASIGHRALEVLRKRREIRKRR
jgi:hypothetical protein